MKILVTGGSGGLGRYVLRALEPIAAEIYHPSRAKLDLTNGCNPLAGPWADADVVVHLAAMTDTSLCEAEPASAVAVNALGTQRLVRACAETRTRLIYMSTDAVFSGGGPHSEQKVPSPSSVYGWSKFAGEQAVATMGENGLIVRANFFTRYCNGKESFAQYVVSRARDGLKFDCYENVCSTPVFAKTLAERIAEAIVYGEHGVLHVASEDAVTRVEQAAMICDAYGMAHNIEPMKYRKYDGRLHPRAPVGTVRSEIEKMVKEEPL